MYKRLLLVEKIIFFFILFIFLKESTAYCLAIYYKYNLKFYKFLSPLDFLFISSAVWHIPIMKKHNVLILLFTLLIILFYGLNFLFFQKTNIKIDSNLKLLKSILLIIYSLLLLFAFVSHPDEKLIFSKSIFWFGTGLLIFNIISIFYWGMYNYFLHVINDKLKLLLRLTFELANYFMYFSLATSIFFNNFSKIRANR